MSVFPPPAFLPRPSPMDAVSPAFSRANALLMRKPFRLRRAWKLAASSYLAILGSVFVPLPILLPVALVMHPELTTRMPSSSAVTMTIVAIICTLILLIFFYLGTCFELVQFEMIVTLADRIGPMWKRQTPRVWPWMGFKIAVGSVLTALVAPLLLSVVSRFFTAFQPLAATMTADKPNVDAIFQFEALFFSFYAVMLVVYAVFLLVSTLLHDFVLPFYELEGLSVGAALGRGWKLIVAEPLQTFFYLIVKGFLALVALMAAGFATQICAIPIFVVGVAVVATTAALHQGPPSAGLIALGVCFIVLLYAALLYIVFGLNGYVMTMLNSYSLYFVGSRYPALGELMNPSSGPPPAFTPPPPMPSPEEHDDGPPLPMDPALA